MAFIEGKSLRANTSQDLGCFNTRPYALDNQVRLPANAALAPADAWGRY